MSKAGITPDPWQECARLEYGADRSLAWTVRDQVTHAPSEERTRLEERLLKALGQPNCTAAGRAFLCEMLALVGTPKSVAVLAPMLRDPKTAEAARYAVQAIPGEEAASALRSALGALTGRLKAGLIGSIAVRRDTTIRAVLAGIKENPSEAAIVREAAARALDHLATGQA
jgi:hypothetical protein